MYGMYQRTILDLRERVNRHGRDSMVKKKDNLI